jgi:peptide/nickel transport system substrate-binding protein
MSRNRLMLALGFVIVLSMVLAACGGGTATVAPATAVPATAVPPTAVPVRNGAIVDKVVFTAINQADEAVTQLQAGQIDLYAYTVSDPNLFATVKGDPKLGYTTSFGSYNEMTFNPILNFTDGRLNPFGDPQIREAMNYLIDRDYISKEIFGGLAVPKYTNLNSAFADYARYIDVTRAIENQYAYNLDKANAIVTERMTALGAVMGADGKWMNADGKTPVVIIGIIRTEDKRKDIGDYFCNQLEKIGFTCDRQYKTRTEASPIWNGRTPALADGGFNFYTGGWITTAISRDDGTNFDYFYTELGGTAPLNVAQKNDPAYHNADNTGCADKLWVNNFATMDERAQLFKECLYLSMKDSNRIWVVDQISFSPTVANLAVTYDLAGGIAGAGLWPFTIQFKGQEGGTVRWAQPGVLVDPWNPIGGSNWIYDQSVERATQDFGTISNPYTGLALPQRVEKLDLVAKTGLPIGKTLDWVTLTFQDKIDVPADAWADWDAKTQTFIPAGEGKTANIKATVTYPADLFTTVKWHDGSALSMGDFVMGMILTFDLAKPDSALYDEAQVASLDAYMSHFKGVKIESTNPLVITTYDDLYALDAENNAFTWWPNYLYGPGSWHALSAGILAETNKELAFSADKATALSIEWMSFIAGPSLAILEKYVGQAGTDNYIPYVPTMGQYVTAEEATARWANLKAWYLAHGNFWIGTGPFYLESVFPVEGSVTIARNPDYPDPSTKWAGFAAPQIPVVDLTGPAEVAIGSTGTFTVTITYNNAPYAAADIDGVKFLVFGADGSLVTTGQATFVADGQYTIDVPTTGMAAGSNKLEVAVTSKLESIPAIVNIQFVTK